MLFLVPAGAPVYGPPGDGPVPLGSVLCVILRGGRLAALAEAAAACLAHRWAPLVVMGTVDEWSAARVLLGTRGNHPLYLSCESEDALPPVEEVIRLVLRQPAPSPDAVGAYVSERSGYACGEAVAAVLAGAPVAQRTRRLLRSRGPLGPHDWLRVQLLLEHLAEAAAGGLSQECVAMRNSTSSRSLSIWTHQFLGISWRSAVALGSWQARLEAVLRKGGYVPDADCREPATGTGETSQRSA